MTDTRTVIDVIPFKKKHDNSDERIRELDREITLIAQTDPVAKRLRQLRGVGPVIAAAIVANVGDAYLRTLLIHGTRPMIRTARAKNAPLSQWVMKNASIRHPDTAAVALANKTARVAWAMMAHESGYQPELVAD